MSFEWISYFSPLLVFLIVGILSFLILCKFQLGNGWVQGFLALFIAMLFVSATNTTDYISKIIPWSVTLLVVGFFIIMTLTFVMGSTKSFMMPLAIVGLIIILFIAIVSAFGAFPGLGTTENIITSKPFVDNFIFVIATLIVGFFLIKG